MGKAVAEMFLSKGFSVAVCARTEKDLHQLKKAWQTQYPSQIVLALPVDMRDTQSVKDFGEQIKQQFPQGINVLVNNAGLFFPGRLADEPEGRLEELMHLHVFSAYHLTRSLLPLMIANRNGHIFNMCSVASLHAYPNGGAYSITKYALMGFSENLRHELMNQHIKVTAITPGAVWTNSWKESGVAEERIMDVDDIAKMVWAAYDLSDRANVDNIIIRPQLGDV